VAYRVDNDNSQRSELKRYTLELETEISLTNPLVVLLESRLTRRSDTAKANSQNQSEQGARFENFPSALTHSNSNSVPELASWQLNNEPASKPSTYVANGPVDKAVTSSSLQVCIKVIYVGPTDSTMRTLCHDYYNVH